MNVNIKKILVLLLSITLFLFPCAQTSAYILQGPHILQLTLENIGKSKELLVEQKLTIFSGSEVETPVELHETVSFFPPEKFRSDIISDNIHRTIIASEGHFLSLVDANLSEYFETEFDLYKDFFLYNSRKLLETRLSLLGVDINTSSFGRFEGRTAYVLGATYPDESVPQIWFDKKTFRPFRWIVIGKTLKNSGDHFEIRYHHWQKKGRIWYPMFIEFFQNNIKVREIKVINVITKPSFKKNVFEMESLRSEHIPVLNIAEDQQNGVSEVQKTIERFKKKYE
ncbi:MAG: hypothetical protein J7K84_11660 [Deltaproteobacteria bacterium]|nr:hypothetical protein [Deltaproteobacteria bacterium]